MLYIASDHAGFEAKKNLLGYLSTKEIIFEDLGAYTFNDQDDYPDFVSALIKKINPKQDRAIIICGSGQGVCIVANRHKDIRAVQAWSTETATLGRKDDDANVLCLAGRAKNIDSLESIIEAFLNTKYENSEKRNRRLIKIENN